MPRKRKRNSRRRSKLPAHLVKPTVHASESKPSKETGISSQPAQEVLGQSGPVSSTLTNTNAVISQKNDSLPPRNLSLGASEVLIGYDGSETGCLRPVHQELSRITKLLGLLECLESDRDAPGSPTPRRAPHCEHCMEVVIDPVQTQCCGLLVCASHVDSVLAKNSASDNGEVPCFNCHSTSLSTVPDKRAARLVASMQIRCPQEYEHAQARGSVPGSRELENKSGVNHEVCCVWVGEYGMQGLHVKQHIDSECVHTQLRCSLCGQVDSRYRMRSHFAQECKQVRVACEWCQTLVARSLLPTHLQQCPAQLIACEHKRCIQMIARRDYNQHVEHKCAYRMVECAMCAERVVLNDMLTHISSNQATHLHSLINTTLSLKQENAQLRRHVHALSDELLLTRLQAGFVPVGKHVDLVLKVRGAVVACVPCVYVGKSARGAEHKALGVCVELGVRYTHDGDSGGSGNGNADGAGAGSAAGLLGTIKYHYDAVGGVGSIRSTTTGMVIFPNASQSHTQQNAVLVSPRPLGTARPGLKLSAWQLRALCDLWTEGQAVVLNFVQMHRSNPAVLNLNATVRLSERSDVLSNNMLRNDRNSAGLSPRVTKMLRFVWKAGELALRRSELHLEWGSDDGSLRWRVPVEARKTISGGNMQLVRVVCPSGGTVSKVRIGPANSVISDSAGADAGAGASAVEASDSGTQVTRVTPQLQHQHQHQHQHSPPPRLAQWETSSTALGTEQKHASHAGSTIHSHSRGAGAPKHTRSRSLQASYSSKIGKLFGLPVD